MASIKITRKDLKATDSKYSPVMKKFSQFKSIKKSLKYKSQQQSFYEALKKNTDPDHMGERRMKKAIKKTLGELLANDKDKIATKDVKEIGKEIFGSVSAQNRFIMPEKEKNVPRAWKSGQSSRIMEVMAHRKEAYQSNVSKQVSRPPQTQSFQPRIPIVGNNELHGKLGAITPSFAGNASGRRNVSPNPKAASFIRRVK